MDGITTCGDAGGRTLKGAPCGMHLNLNPESGLCLNHDPTRQAEALEMRVAGAKARAAKLRKRKAAMPKDCPPAPKTLREAEAVASWITFAVLSGELDPKVAEAGVKSVRQFQLTIEKRTLQDRVKELERALREARK